MKKKLPLKQRLEHDENFMLKLGKQLGEAYSQFGDLFRLMREQQAQLEKMKKDIKKLERKLDHAIHKKG